MEDNPSVGKVHFLPHRPVITSDLETTKICIEFDASAHVNGKPCVNDIFEPGPCLIPLILDILLRFRTGKFGLVVDIKQAFLINKYSRGTSRLPSLYLASRIQP